MRLVAASWESIRRSCAYLRMAADNLGVTEESRIEQRGEPIRAVRTDFKLIDNFRDVRLA